eukprot:CCRYP_005711-RA/>CCRYP_005711-RA protein AED:0.04 eAED:0.06 QI:1328/0/0.33/1/0/0/3/0/344
MDCARIAHKLSQERGRKQFDRNCNEPSNNPKGNLEASQPISGQTIPPASASAPPPPPLRLRPRRSFSEGRTSMAANHNRHHPGVWVAAIFIFTVVVQVDAFMIGRSSWTVGVITKNPAQGLSKTVSPRSMLVPPTTALQSTALPLCLSNLPTWIYYSLLHILGGNIGTPIVIRATKSWYKRIPLPEWTPPNFVFAPVWTILYSLMGVSVSRVLKAGISNNSNVMNLWKVHYALNIVWAPVFFGFQYLRLGLFINVALVSTLIVVLRLFYSTDPVAAYVQVPYLLWLLYATKLNQAICALNPTIGGINEARLQADLCADGDGYNDAMLEYDIGKLQAAAAEYAGL